MACRGCHRYPKPCGKTAPQLNMEAIFSLANDDDFDRFVNRARNLTDCKFIQI